MEKKGWGGARPGAGRKGFSEKTVPVCWRISEKSKEWLQGMATELGMPMGAIIDILIDSFIEESNKDGLCK